MSVKLSDGRVIKCSSAALRTSPVIEAVLDDNDSLDFSHFPSISLQNQMLIVLYLLVRDEDKPKVASQLGTDYRKWLGLVHSANMMGLDDLMRLTLERMKPTLPWMSVQDMWRPEKNAVL